MTAYASRNILTTQPDFSRGTFSSLARMARPYGGKGSQWQSVSVKESCKGNHQIYLVSYLVS